MPNIFAIQIINHLSKPKPNQMTNKNICETAHILKQPPHQGNNRLLFKK